MDFSRFRSIAVPEGDVASIAHGDEILWEKQWYQKELEYLETTGDQYIKTGVTTTGNTRVVAQMMALEKGATGRYVYLFSSKTNLFSVRMHWSNGRPYNTYGSTDSIIFYESEVGDVLNINFGSGTATINTYSKNIPYVEFTDGELQIFARNGGYRSKARLWTFQVYDGETLVRDFIPVLDWDNVPCLYDNVSRELFYNQGAGAFLYA